MGFHKESDTCGLESVEPENENIDLNEAEDESIHTKASNVIPVIDALKFVIALDLAEVLLANVIYFGTELVNAPGFAIVRLFPALDKSVNVVPDPE